MKYPLLLGSIGIATALRFAQLLAQPSHMDAAANFPPQVVAASEPANYANPGTFPSTVNLQPTPLEALSRQSASGISRQVGLNAVAADELRMLMATLRQHQAMAEPAEAGLRTDRQISRLARRLQGDADFLAEISTRLCKIYSTLTPEQAATFDAILHPSRTLPPPLA